MAGGGRARSGPEHRRAHHRRGRHRRGYGRRVRVLIAPDDFKGTLTAVEAADAIAAGWRSAAPQDELTLLPLSDGGPGFVSAIDRGTSQRGEHIVVTVRGPLGEPVPAEILVVDGTAYVESAQACGLHLIPEQRRDPAITSTYGVGELILAAIEARAGVRRIVIGLGGSGTTDAGAGMLAALGVQAWDAEGNVAPLDRGGAMLASVERIDLAPALACTAGVEIIAASDVDAPLLGPEGAAHGFAPQKGADAQGVADLERALTAFARTTGGDAEADGAGAAGGLGYGLLLLGARRAPGIATVAEAVGLDASIAACDLVITGEGCCDWQSLRGKVVSGVAAAALVQARPAVVIAGRVLVGRRELAAIGVTEAYAIDEGQAPPGQALQRCSARVAGQWSRGGTGPVQHPG